MINKLIFKFGSSPDIAPLTLDLEPITVFVGPNNSGKSRVLIEIEENCRRGYPQDTDKIINNLEYMSWSEAEINRELSLIRVDPDEKETVHPNHIIVRKLNPQTNSRFRTQIHSNKLINEGSIPK